MQEYGARGGEGGRSLSFSLPPSLSSLQNEDQVPDLLRTALISLEASKSGQEEAEGVAVVALPGRPGEPQLLVHDGVDGVDGGVLLPEQKKSQLGLEKHQ